MGIDFAPGKYNRASGTLSAFDRWADALVAAGHPRPRVIDGDRELAGQRTIWDQRMVTADRVAGRRVYGTQKWQGITWYQIHPDTVAPPDASNHVKRRSNDLAHPYNADTAAHRYAKKIAPQFNITCEGENFREKWHWTFWGALGNIDRPGSAAASAGNNSTSLEDIMANLDKEDRDWLDAQFSNLRKIIVVPDQNYGAAQAVLNEIKVLSPLVKDTQIRVRGTDPRGDMLQLILEKLGLPINAEVDEGALARELAPLLPAYMGSLSDQDVDRLAKAAADEQAKRLAG
jgi:hypothetical protein